MWSEMAASLQNGDPYVVTIFLMGFLASVVLFERFIMLQFVYNIDFYRFLGNLKRAVRAEDLDRAVNICRNASHTSLPRIGLKALESADTDPTTVKGTIEEETLDFLPKIESRLSILPAMATLILFMGILGTIDALWGAFGSIEVLDTAEKQARLAHGISASLNPTTMGLLMCMILLAGHQILRSIAVKLTERLHYGISVLSNLLVPQEVATYVSAAPNSGTESATHVIPSADEYSADATTDSEATQEEEDDSFDDATVEDIKDEEEII